MIVLIQEAVSAAEPALEDIEGMKTGGWIFISLAWTVITSLVVFCYRKILKIAEQRRTQNRLSLEENSREVENERIYQ